MVTLFFSLPMLLNHGLVPSHIELSQSMQGVTDSWCFNFNDLRPKRLCLARQVLLASSHASERHHDEPKQLIKYIAIS